MSKSRDQNVSTRQNLITNKMDRLPDPVLVRLIRGYKTQFEAGRDGQFKDARFGRVFLTEVDREVFGPAELGWVPPELVDRICDVYVYGFAQADGLMNYKVRFSPTPGANELTPGEMRHEEFRVVFIKFMEGERGGVIAKHPNTGAILKPELRIWRKYLKADLMPLDRHFKARVHVGDCNKLTITPYQFQDNDLEAEGSETDRNPLHVEVEATGEKLHVLTVLRLFDGDPETDRRPVNGILRKLTIKEVETQFFSPEFQQSIHPDAKANFVAKKAAAARSKRAQEARMKLKDYIKTRDNKGKTDKKGNGTAPAEQHYADPLKEALFGDPPTLNPETASVEQLEAGLEAAARAVTPPVQQKAVGLPPPPDTTGMTAEQSEAALQAYAQMVVKATEGTTTTEEAMAMIRQAMPPAPAPATPAPEATSTPPVTEQPAPATEAPAALTSPPEPAPAQEPPVTTEPAPQPPQAAAEPEVTLPAKPDVAGLSKADADEKLATWDDACKKIIKVTRSRQQAKAAKGKGKNEPRRETQPNNQGGSLADQLKAKGLVNPAAGKQR